MNKNDILIREKFLLQKYENLDLERINNNEEIKQINMRIQNYISEKEIYKKFKKEVLDRYFMNIFQITGTGVLVDAPIHLLSGNYNNFMTADYIIAGCVAFTLTILTVDSAVILNNYKKNNKLDLDELEKRKEELTKILEQNELEINTTFNELEEVYDNLVSKDVKVKKKQYS